MGDFDGKVVLITGAAAGIGRAAAIGFAQAGAKVVVADIDVAGMNETVASIGDAAIGVAVNVGDEVSCQAMVDATVATFGRLDVLFSNAGISGNRARTADVSTQDWHRVININLNGVFFCARAAIPEMLKTGGGVIVNTASVDGQVGMATVPHYVASKHAVIGLTKNIALEYGRDNIRAVAIAPGFVATQMTAQGLAEEDQALLNSMIPLGRAARPEEIANMVLWLSSDKASYVTGSCHNVDAGLVSGFSLPG